MSLLLLLFIASVYDDVPITRNLDPEYIPDTYAEYIAGQPEYTELTVTPIIEILTVPDILVVMEKNMSDSLNSDIVRQWLKDIESTGNSVSLVEITYSDPVKIREWLADRYSKGLKGVVFVGDIPAPWSATVDPSPYHNNQTFPSDYYYMDLDGEWKDEWIGFPTAGRKGQDKIFDGWSGELMPEIYTGRIITSPVIWGNEYDLIEEYLVRRHEWCLNGDPAPRALCYVDDAWYAHADGFKASMELLYKNIDYVKEKPETNGTDYRQNRLQAGYTWLSPFVHSSNVRHLWSPKPYTLTKNIWDDKPNAKFYNLFACTNCLFTSEKSMGCVYVFGSGEGLAAVGSTKSGSMLKHSFFYEPLGKGANMGEAYAAWWTKIATNGINANEAHWHLGMVILGDPTIIPASTVGIRENESVSITGPTLRFSANPAQGAVSVSASNEFIVYDMTGREITVGNSGETTLDLQTGLYLVRSENAGISLTEKLCVIR